MQFSTSTIATVALAMTVTAAPTTNPSTSCSSTQTPSCVNNNYPGFIGITLALLNILNQQCPTGSSIACCDTSGVQNGLINVGTVCVPVNVVV